MERETIRGQGGVVHGATSSFLERSSTGTDGPVSHFQWRWINAPADRSMSRA
jgi:hypothetical protein